MLPWMNRNDAELWGGAAVILLGAVLLLAPIFVALRYTFLLLIVGVVGLAVGSVLVGLSRRGRAV